MFKRILIANRGEIACRIIRSCREMGIETVAVYSEPDADALHVQQADCAECVGPAAASESYLNQQVILDAARKHGAEAIHPGYGFLSENAGFAQAVVDAGLVWIGPTPAAIEAMGLKVAARETAREAGVPLVPGVEDAGNSDAELLKAAESLGYPVLAKASAGGGGKGMRLVNSADELVSAVAAARREAKAAFGDDTVYLEKYIQRPRHIEVQVLADAHGKVVHLGERECSIQRRHQKVVEEAPSPVVDAAKRAEIGAAAVSLAERIGYVGAGTVEFIADADGNFYFLEMNTRLQVEHPVTEFAYGIDLVRWQLRIAAGEELTLEQNEIAPRGHSIEVRVYAENPANGFLPSAGTVHLLREPAGPGVRTDSMLVEGMDLLPDYDPMLSKLIVWDEDRASAINKLLHALDQYTILGPVTNLAFLRDVLSNADFASGEIDTGFIEREMPNWKPREAVDSDIAAAALALALGSSGTKAEQGERQGSIASPWQTLGNWSNT